jgi:aspartokinase
MLIESIGASEINISCVIEEKDAIRAMNVLHTRLFTYDDPAPFLSKNFGMI